MAEPTAEQLKAIGLDKLTPAEQVEVAKRECAKWGKSWRFRYWYWIKDKAGGMGPIEELKTAQKKVLSVIEWMRKKGKPVRVVVAKSRKMGVSTVIAADALDEVMGRQLDAIVIAHDKVSAHKIFEIYARFYKNLELVKPAPYKGKLSIQEMRFDNHDGHIMVQTAGNVYAGTALTPQYIHCSESGKWDHGVETLTSLNQCIGDEAGTTMIHESTFNGNETCFLPIWRAAVENCEVKWGEIDKKTGLPRVTVTVTNMKEWNGYVPVFIGCLEDEDIWQDFDTLEEKEAFGQTLDDYEQSLVERHGAELEQLNKLRWMLKQKCQNDPAIRKQEYPVTYQEGIRASGRPRFNVDKLDSQPIERGERGRIDAVDRWMGRMVWRPDPQEFLIRYRSPEPGHRYVVGVDTAEGRTEEGSKTADNTVIQVVDMDAGGEQAAVYCSRVITPENLVPVVHAISVYYSNAFVVIERNGQGGVVAIEMGKRYPRQLLFHDGMFKMHDGGHRMGQIGWQTHIGNRHKLVAHLADAIQDDRLTLHCEDTVDECRQFVYKDSGRVEAATGKHDDHVFALAMCVIGMNFYPERLNMGRQQSESRMDNWRARRATADAVCGY